MKQYERITEQGQISRARHGRADYSERERKAAKMDKTAQITGGVLLALWALAQVVAAVVCADTFRLVLFILLTGAVAGYVAAVATSTY